MTKLRHLLPRYLTGRRTQPEAAQPPALTDAFAPPRQSSGVPSRTKSAQPARVFTAWRRDQRINQAWTLANMSFLVFYIVRLFVEPPWLPRLLPAYVVAALACASLGVWLSNRPVRQHWRRRARPQWRPCGHIAPDVLELVHEGIRAARYEDLDRLTTAIERVRSQDQAVQREVLDVLMAMNALALYAVLGQRWPETYSEKDALVKDFVQYASWLAIEPITVHVFIDRLTKPETLLRLSYGKDKLGLIFAVVDWGLVDLPKPPSMSSRDFQSEIEKTLETGDGRLPRVWLV